MKKKGKLFKRLFLSLAILGTLLVSAFTLFMIFTSVRSAYTSVHKAKLDQIKQVQTNFEINLQNFEYAFSAYSTTRSFNDLVSNPLTYAEFAKFNETNSQLNYIGTMGLEGTKYSLLSLNHNWLIENDTLFQKDAEYMRLMEAEYVDLEQGDLFWKKEDAGLNFIISLPITAREKTALIVAQVPNASVDKLVNSNTDSEKFILNSEMNLIYNSKNLEEKVELLDLERLKHEFDQSGLNASKFVIDRNDFICNYSQYNGWNYCITQSSRDIIAMVLPSILMYLALGLSILGLLLWFAYKFSLSYSEPIKTMQEFFPDLTNGDENELESLSKSLSTMLSEKQVLNTMWENEMPQLESQFILNLYRNRMIKREVDEKMIQLGYRDYDPETNSFVSMLIQIDDMGEHRDAEKDLMLVVIQRIVIETITPEYCLRPIILNDTTQATILKFPTRDYDKNKQIMAAFAQEVVNNARDYVRVSISVGIGEQFDSLIRMRESSEMAKQALRHRITVGKESVIFYQDIAKIMSGPVVIEYPLEYERQLFDAISLADEELARTILKPLLEDIIQMHKDPSSVEMVCIRLVNNLIEFQTQLGISRELHEINREVYKRILGSYNAHEIERVIFTDMIKPMVYSIKEKTEKQVNGLSEQIVAVLEQRYNEDISLEIIADELHYNPNYLSRIFKREIGMNFSDYLIQFRIEVAKKMLKDPDLTIKDIAEKLQYSNSQNFIRTFRKSTGVTPGVYRKEQGNDASH